MELVRDPLLSVSVQQPGEEEDGEGPGDVAEEGGGEHELPVPGLTSGQAATQEDEDDQLTEESQAPGAVTGGRL